MSLEAAVAFIRKVSEDEVLYIAIKKLDGRDFDALLKLAADYGHTFSVDHWKTAVARIAGELRDADLDQVVGGTTLLSSTSFQLTVSPVLQTYMKPFNPLADKCGAACGPSCGGSDGDPD